jgi:hypothetical protein
VVGFVRKYGVKQRLRGFQGVWVAFGYLAGGINLGKVESFLINTKENTEKNVDVAHLTYKL